MNAPRRVAVLGAGTWGMTLAILLHEKGIPVSLWDLSVDFARRLEAERENSRALPGIKLPTGLRVYDDLSQTIEGASLLVVATPTQSVRTVGERLRQLDASRPGVVDVAKGIEVGTGMRPSEILAETLARSSRSFVTLSGPSHAEEVSRHIPTAVVAASVDRRAAADVAKLFETKTFRVFTNSDPIGVELSGALKNVVAIAAGMLDGLGAGDNTKAALLTRGQTEIARLGVAMGGRPDTFWGLAGIGDLIVTCMSRHSRNRFVGEEVGKGKKLSDVLAGMVMVAEGVATCQAAYELAKKHKVEMPIIEQVHAVLFKDRPARAALDELLSRPIGSEGAGIRHRKRR